jgi:hypothetical protein
MIKVKLIGWKKGLQTISLIKLTQQLSNNSLSSAKDLIEQLISGKEVTLTFQDESTSDKFKKEAAILGAVIE